MNQARIDAMRIIAINLRSEEGENSSRAECVDEMLDDLEAANYEISTLKQRLRDTLQPEVGQFQHGKTY